MKTIQDLKEALLVSVWEDTNTTNYQETHMHVDLDGDLIYAQYVCVTESGKMFNCNIFADPISAEGFVHLFIYTNWFTIPL